MSAKLRVLSKDSLVRLWNLRVKAVPDSVYPLEVRLLLVEHAASDRRVRLVSHSVVWPSRG